MSNKKKAYSTPNELKGASSASLAVASFLWILNLIWQYAMAFLRPTGSWSLLCNLVGFALLFAAAILSYNALETELQADAIENEKTDRSLPVLKKLVIVCIVMRIVLILVSILLELFLRSAQNTPLYETPEAIISIFANIFTTTNILGIFAYKIYIRDGGNNRVRVYALIALITFIARFLLTGIRYVLQAANDKPVVLSYLATFVTIVSYFALFLMFEARKALYLSKTAPPPSAREPQE